jgi:hypothetical protein
MNFIYFDPDSQLWQYCAHGAHQYLEFVKKQSIKAK